VAGSGCAGRFSTTCRPFRCAMLAADWHPRGQPRRPAATPTPLPLALPHEPDQTNGAADLTRLADVAIPSFRRGHATTSRNTPSNCTIRSSSSPINTISSPIRCYGQSGAGRQSHTLSVGQVLNILRWMAPLRIVQSGEPWTKFPGLSTAQLKTSLFPGNDLDPAPRI